MPRTSLKQLLERDISYLLTLDVIFELVSQAPRNDDANDPTLEIELRCDNESSSSDRLLQLSFLPKPRMIYTPVIPLNTVRDIFILLDIILPNIRYLEPRIQLPRMVDDPLEWLL